jgi:CRP/FNR family cyclic AMP-dependent transcriptional regulator
VRLGTDPKIELLKKVPLFQSCSKRSLEEIAKIADEVDISGGTELIRQGDRGRQFFILLEGGADVRRDGDVVNQMEAGDFFGEIALIGGGETTATVSTTAPSRALVITPRDFKRLLRESEEVQEQVLEELARRLPAAQS